MNKQKKRTKVLCCGFFCFILLGAIATETNASGEQPVLMKRSSEVLKFNVANNTSVNLTSQNGMLRKVETNKAGIDQDTDKQKTNNQDNEQPESPKGLTVSSQYSKAENLYRLVITVRELKGPDTNGGSLSQLSKRSPVTDKRIVLAKQWLLTTQET